MSRSFLVPRIYKTVHRPPYETAKTEDLSSNFLSLQEIQMAYSKFKQLFLIGEKNPEPKLAVTWKKTCYMARVKGGALSLGSSWSDTAIGVGVTEQRGRLPWGWWPLPHFLPPFSPGLLSHCPFSARNTEPPFSLPSPAVSIGLLPLEAVELCSTCIPQLFCKVDDLFVFLSHLLNGLLLR